MNVINTNLSKTDLRKQLSNMPAVDIAKQYTEFSEEEQKFIIELIPHNKVDDVFIELSAEEAINFFNQLDLVRQRILITDLNASNLKPLFEEFDNDDKMRFFELLDYKKRLKLEKLLLYSETEAPSVMENDFLKFNVNYDIGEAMRYLSKNVRDLSFIDIIYVVDDNNELVGLVNLKELIIARKHETIKDILKPIKYYVYESSSLEKAINTIKDYDLNVIPVINDSFQLIGIITANAIFEEIALTSESQVDKFVSVGEFDESSNAFERTYQRLPWLLVSIVLNLVIALFLSIFSDTINTIKALILFQPMILGMAGNIGTQSIAVTIVALHLKKHDTKEKLKAHIKKETLIGVFNSLLIGLIGFFLTFGFLSISNFDASASISPFYLSLSIGISLVFSMILSAFFGVGIPILLDKMKIDPAIASGPVISTINDLVALAIYFGVASIMIQLLL